MCPTVIYVHRSFLELLTFSLVMSRISTKKQQIHFCFICNLYTYNVFFWSFADHYRFYGTLCVSFNFFSTETLNLFHHNCNTIYASENLSYIFSGSQILRADGDLSDLIQNVNYLLFVFLLYCNWVTHLSSFSAKKSKLCGDNFEYMFTLTGCGCRPRCGGNDCSRSRLYIAFGGWLIWQRRHRHILHAVDVCDVDQGCKNRFPVLVSPLCARILLHGKCPCSSTFIILIITLKI